MKLLGRKNETHVVASIGHHDYQSHHGLIADGGQPGCTDYSGYNRFGGEGETVYFEVPQDFAELYSDYQFAGFRPNWPERKYGIWKLQDVRILDKAEWPDTESFEWKVQNAIWGTYGKNGDEPKKYILLVDADTAHLTKIYNISSIRGTTGDTDVAKIVCHILKERGVVNC